MLSRAIIVCLCLAQVSQATVLADLSQCRPPDFSELDTNQKDQLDIKSLMSAFKAMDQKKEWSARCSDAVGRYCQLQNKPTLEEPILHHFFRELAGDPRFKMPNPARKCAQRAYLINKFLSDRGYKSELMVIQAPSIVGIMYEPKGQVKSIHVYSIHVAASVVVEGVNGKPERFVIDPQFFEAPMRIGDYLRIATGGGCQFVGTSFSPEAERAKEYRCSYIVQFPLGNPQFELDPSSEKNLDQACAWTKVQEFEDKVLDKKDVEPIDNANLMAEVRFSSRPQVTALATLLKRTRRTLQGEVEAWSNEREKPVTGHLKDAIEYYLQRAHRALAEFDLGYGATLSQ
ncbi:MAG: protein-glutamine glutaminase family protein [Bdellovibrionales bacterium]